MRSHSCIVRFPLIQLSLQHPFSRNLVFIIASLLLGQTLCVLAHTSQAQAASSQSRLTAERLTQELVTLNARYVQATASEREQLLNSLLSMAADRQQLLASLVKENPRAVLRTALPSTLRVSLPSAVQPYIEKEVEVHGKLSVLYEDYESESRLLYVLETATERLSLHFADNPPQHLLTGTLIHVAGVQIDGALVLESKNTSSETSASNSGTTTTSTVLPNTFGARKTLVILVNFQDNTAQPYTVADAWDVVFGETSDFLYENSYQQTWLTGDVAGWYTIPFTSTVCDISSIADYAKAAASAAGYNLAVYTHYIYAFPQNACGGMGMGTLGGNPSQVWVNGSGMSLKVVSHELGHSFGLYHAHALDCGASVLGTGCSLHEYGDRFDTMGNTSAGHYNAFQKERLGWLDYGASPAMTTVEASGLYTIEPLETSGAGPKALAILKSTDPTTGQQTWYYVEYRQALGFDSFLAINNNILNGVVVHTGSLSSGDSSNLLDMTPASGLQNWSDWSDPALEVGQSFSDPDSGVTIAPVSVSSTGATVSVNFASPACVRTNPTVVLSPSQSQLVQPGATISFTVLVTNNDNTSCPASIFTLQSVVPTGWTATLSSSALTLNPGASASTTLQITSPATAAGGSYTSSVTATNSTDTNYTDSASTTIELVSGLNAIITTDKASYSRGQNVILTVGVKVNGSPAANASVTITITKANGAMVKQTVTTGTSGNAVSQLRLKKNDPVGSYKVRADASLNGISGNATTSFIVQ